ncbi:hypothetical protein MB84_03270 [Pandoraea oxalativorans]|uniref:Autotransporter domain-containing protein n=1 Tax=Pandoraea oxalativorans TaxID=573737 RepID=A0A0E3U4Y3_9BURK|nr:hypothetical protein MB84_03270 [Pandoraea oxalativorans]
MIRHKIFKKNANLSSRKHLHIGFIRESSVRGSHADEVTSPTADLTSDSRNGHSRKKVLLSPLGRHHAILAAAIAALVPSARAFAQCSPAPATLSISSGSCSDPASTARESTGAAPVVEVSGTGSYSGNSVNLSATGSGYGMLATGGGTITLLGSSTTGNTISTFGTGGHGLYAVGGGVIAGSYVAVDTNDAGAYGVGAVGAGSRVSLTDSALSTVADNAHGAYAASGGAITLTRTDVTTYGMGASAIFADAGGAITLNNLNTFSFGDNAAGAVATGAGSRLTLNNTFVNILGNGSTGLSATGGGGISMVGGAIASGDYYGVTVIANAPGMLARGGGSNIQVSNGATSATYGANSPGVWADAGGKVNFSGFGIFTYQPNSPGALASGADSSIALTDTIVRTSGPSSAGLSVTDAGTVTVTGTEVTSGYRPTGSSPPVLQFPDTSIGSQANGADVTGAGSQLLADRTRITANGDGAIGVKVSQGARASITGGSITTRGQSAPGAVAENVGSDIVLTRTAITTAGSGAHGIAAIGGGTLSAVDTTVAVSGAGSAAIHLAGVTPSAISFTGGSLSATSGAIVYAEGGTGIVSISDGTAIAAAMVNGRRLLAQVTENASGTPSNLTLNIARIPSLAGDIVVDPSTLTYNLVSSNWTGNLVLLGQANTANANLSASQWTGDLLADAGNTADVTLTQGSLWTGLARNATKVAIDASSVWNVTGDSNATGTVANAGLIQFVPRSGSYSTLTVGSYTGSAGSRIGFNTYLGADNSPTNLLVIKGGQASGTTAVVVDNTGGPGAQTVADGIRLVQVSDGGTTTTGAFTLARRVAAGAYEYQLFRGGSTSPDDWFLRSYLSDKPADPATPVDAGIALYRPEVALYSPIPAIARQMGLATLGTLHERVGEEENLRGLPGPRPYANGVWGRVFGGRVNNRWDGTVNSSASGNLVGFQTGLDIFRRTTDEGHRDHAGVYFAYSDFDSPSVRGFALGTQDLTVGKLVLNGPSAGAYWTHFAPGGGYLDAVVQASWYDAKATCLYGSGMSTKATGYTASLESGYPFRFGKDDRWLIEPQAQIVYQGVSVRRSGDQYSDVDWNAGKAWTARLGARLQYTEQDERGRLWQPYARVNLWHVFPVSDTAFFGPSSPGIETRIGDTALEIGGGITARVNQYLSFYGQASYRWSVGSVHDRRTTTAGTLGVRVNW